MDRDSTAAYRALLFAEAGKAVLAECQVAARLGDDVAWMSPAGGAGLIGGGWWRGLGASGCEWWWGCLCVVGGGGGWSGFVLSVWLVQAPSALRHRPPANKLPFEIVTENAKLASGFSLNRQEKNIFAGGALPQRMVTCESG